MTLKNGFGKFSLFVITARGWKDQNMASSFSHQRKSYYGEGVVWLANLVAVWREREVSVEFNSRKFSGIKFFHPSLRLTNQKPRAFVSGQWINLALFPFDSFVVCVFLARFHFKVIRKSLYLTFSLVVLFFCLFF